MKKQCGGGGYKQYRQEGGQGAYSELTDPLVCALPHLPPPHLRQRFAAQHGGGVLEQLACDSKQPITRPRPQLMRASTGDKGGRQRCHSVKQRNDSGRD